MKINKKIKKPKKQEKTIREKTIDNGNLRT